MAKAKLVEDEVIVNGAESVSIQADEVVINEVQEEKPAVSVATVNGGAKMVKVTATDKVDCLIANKPYIMAKGKTYSVPSDVAAVLVNAKKVYRV